MKVLPYLEVAGNRYNSFPDMEAREQIEELETILEGGGQTVIEHTEYLYSTEDQIGTSFVDVSTLDVGTKITLNTDATNVMSFKNKNWCPVRNLTATSTGTTVDLDMPLPTGYYTVSAVITGYDGSVENLPTVTVWTYRSDGDYHGALDMSRALWSQNGGRVGCLFTNGAAIDDLASIKFVGANVELSDVCVRYFPEVPWNHPVNGTDNTRFDYAGDYDCVLYNAGEEITIDGSFTTLLASDNQPFNVGYTVTSTVGGTEGLVQTVAGINSRVNQMSNQIGGLSAGTVPIYKDSPDYDYTSLNLTGGWSDFTFVGNELWVFKASDHDDHDNINGVLTICNLSNGAKKTIAHNLGHCNTVHYNPKNGKLLVSNMPEEPYSLYIFDNVASWSTKSTVTLESEPHTTIDVSKIGDAQATICCWGDENNGQHNIVYVNGAYNKYWWKILLGTGTNDLGKGTYTEADSGQYNGTYKVLQSWTFDRRYIDGDGKIDAEREVTQGIDFVNGRIHTSNGHHELQWWEWDFSDSFVSRREHNITLYEADGSVNPTLSEGFAIHDGYAYVGCIFAYVGGDGRYGLTSTNGFIKVKL